MGMKGDRDYARQPGDCCIQEDTVLSSCSVGPYFLIVATIRILSCSSKD